MVGGFVDGPGAVQCTCNNVLCMASGLVHNKYDYYSRK